MKTQNEQSFLATATIAVPCENVNKAIDKNRDFLLNDSDAILRSWRFYFHGFFFQLKIEDERKFPTFQSISVRENTAKRGRRSEIEIISRIHSESFIHLQAKQWIAWDEMNPSGAKAKNYHPNHRFQWRIITGDSFDSSISLSLSLFSCSLCRFFSPSLIFVANFCNIFFSYNLYAKVMRFKFSFEIEQRQIAEEGKKWEITYNDRYNV